MQDVLAIALILGWGVACFSGWLAAADRVYDLGRGMAMTLVGGLLLVLPAFAVFLLGFFLIAEVVGSG